MEYVTKLKKSLYFWSVNITINYLKNHSYEKAILTIAASYSFLLY